MSEPSTDPVLAPEEPPAPTPEPEWPDDPVEMMNQMLAEQSASLHLMFYDLRDYGASVFAESPDAAQEYIRLALRAQANCRSALDAVARANRAARPRHADELG